MRHRLAVFAVIVSASFVATGAGAGAQTPPSAPVVDQAFEAAKRVFEALPDVERRGIQDALIWTGDYKGVVDGGFGRGTRAAIVAYAKRAGSPDDGTLDAKGRAALTAAANVAKAAAGFAVVKDSRSGVSFSLPLKILVKRVDTKTGSRWTSADGQTSVETSQTNESDGDLPSLFDKEKDSSPARRVTYKILRPDFFVVSGEAGKTAYYHRVARGVVGGVAALRGYTIGFPAGSKGSENFSVAIANSFDPFGVAPAAARVAASSATAPPPGGLVVSPAPPLPPPIARPVIVASAVNVGADRAASVLGKCENPKVAGRPARVIKRDEATGLTLLEARGFGGRALAIVAGEMEAATPALALFQNPAGNGSNAALVVASGETLANGRVLAPLQETSLGGAVFDRKGALLGLVGARTAPTRVAGVVPQTAWPMISASALSAFVGPATQAASASGDVATAADIVARSGPAIVSVACDR